ncbi:hypothetical protein D3C85_1510620 [compost metagenome]
MYALPISALAPSSSHSSRPGQRIPGWRSRHAFYSFPGVLQDYERPAGRHIEPQRFPQQRWVFLSDKMQVHAQDLGRHLPLSRQTCQFGEVRYEAAQTNDGLAAIVL